MFQTCISVHVEVLQKQRGISIESNRGIRGIENREYDRENMVQRFGIIFGENAIESGELEIND